MNWIKVCDKLPQSGERVLFATRTCFVAEGYVGFIESAQTWYRITGYDVEWAIRDKVVAWCELPKYEGGK